MRYLILSLLFVGCSGLQVTQPNEQPKQSVNDSLAIELVKSLKGARIKDKSYCENYIHTVYKFAKMGNSVDSLVSIIPINCIER